MTVGASALAGSSRLTYLDLRDNLIGDAGVSAYATSPSLTFLNLGDNLINDTGGRRTRP